MLFRSPIDVAMEIQSQLRTVGRVQRGRIGVVIQEVSKELAESFGLSKPQGALVNAVEKGGPAEKAGVEVGDIITKFDGKAVSSSSDLPRIVGSTKPGTRSAVEVYRKGATREITVTGAQIAAIGVAIRNQHRAGVPTLTGQNASRERVVLITETFLRREFETFVTTTGREVDHTRDCVGPVHRRSAVGQYFDALE